MRHTSSESERSSLYDPSSDNDLRNTFSSIWEGFESHNSNYEFSERGRRNGAKKAENRYSWTLGSHKGMNSKKESDADLHCTIITIILQY
ncbi:hypothetical protein Avbf_13632 [Armadillidium vulgare]|nr:hypothetical protein Avbf_13632 [Armadillidium vulgare]